MKKLLITGGAGFIGANFIYYIMEKHPDYFVVNLDLITYSGNLKSLVDLKGNDNYKFVKGSILDVNLVEKLVKECDIVINFAAESHVDRSIKRPTIFTLTNILGTQVLLDACLKYKKRFHQISTDEVFGDLPLEGGEKFVEKTLYKPSSPYSASKASADHLVRAYHKTFGLEITITNCSNNYGRFQHPEKFIPRMIIKALSDKKLPIYGDGKNMRDWIYVNDHCSAIDLVIHKGKIGETYLVGGNECKSNISLAREILVALNKDISEVEFVSDRLGHDLRYEVDSSKIEKELGWTRKYDFEEGLRQTIDWYKNNKSWWGGTL